MLSITFVFENITQLPFEYKSMEIYNFNHMQLNLD
jgi:hypothetical protein